MTRLSIGAVEFHDKSKDSGYLNMFERMKRIAGSALKCFCMALAIVGGMASEALAHGERNQEPFLRMRTLHWYDIQFSQPEGTKLKINDLITITGKVRLFGYRPKQVPEPESLYLNANSAGPAFVKVESWVNDKSSIQSFAGKLGRDYEFKLVLKARWEGDWHVHPMINSEDGGGLIGPGIWFNVNGAYSDFVHPAQTLAGVNIENLETWGLGRVYTWHALWLVIGVVYLLWWLRRPILIPRWLMVKNGDYEDVLVTRSDKVFGGALMVITLVLVIGSALYISQVYPNTVPLQGSRAFIEPLDAPPTVKVTMKEGKYFVPGRSLVSVAEVTNTADKPIQLGEFTSANLRFIDKSVPGAAADPSGNFPHDLIPQSGLKVSDNSPLMPGEKRVITIETTDAAWEVERLAALVKDPENNMGALLFFYDGEGKRYISEIFGSVIPVFVQ